MRLWISCSAASTHRSPVRATAYDTTMSRVNRAVACLLLAATCTTGADTVQDFTKHVNLFIGTEGPIPGLAWNAGNVFPGASLPFGAAKVGIDTTRLAIPTIGK